MTEISTIESPRSARQIIEVNDAVPVLDTARFEHMQRIATVLARSSLLPKSLTTEGKRDSEEPLPFEQIFANAFLVVNQAVRWGLDPFAVAQCVSVVHGKLCYEGKLVAAVIEAKAGIRLRHHFIGEGEGRRIYLSDVDFTPDLVASLKPGIRPIGLRMFDGSVAEWKTTGAGTPWSPKNFDRMLLYRGTRDWTRIYEPALMLGVYTDDEMLDLADNARAARARPVGGMAERLAAARAQQGGFSSARVEHEIAGAITSQQPKEEPHQDQTHVTAADEIQGRLDDLGSVQDGRKMSTDGQVNADPSGVTAGETATSSNLSDAAPGSDRRTESGEDAPPSTSLSVDDRRFLGEFAKAIRPGNDPKQLFDLRQAFGKKAARRLEAGTPERKALEKIYAIETRRATGEISVDEADAQIEGLLS